MGCIIPFNVFVTVFIDFSGEIRWVRLYCKHRKGQRMIRVFMGVVLCAFLKDCPLERGGIQTA